MAQYHCIGNSRIPLITNHVEAANREIVQRSMHVLQQSPNRAHRSVHAASTHGVNILPLVCICIEESLQIGDT